MYHPSDSAFDMVCHRVEVKDQYIVKIAQASDLEIGITNETGGGYKHLDEGFDLNKLTDMSNFKLKISNQPGRGKSISKMNFHKNDDLGVGERASEERKKTATKDIIIKDCDENWYKFYLAATNNLEDSFDRDRSGFPPFFNEKNLEKRYGSFEDIEREIKLNSILNGLDEK